jgi:hypothetical protein
VSGRKAAIVTGGGTGVGAASALLLDSGVHLGTAMRAVVPPRG